MCELLGMCFNKQVKHNISFRGFRNRGSFNPDGWGIAFYPDKSAQVIKEPLSSGVSSLSKFLQEYDLIKSKIFISHVRYASCGGKTYKNTHPFQREYQGVDYVFAHNGTLKDYRDELTLTRFKPIGDTDSEYAFCYIMSGIEEKDITCWTNQEFLWLHGILRNINNFGDFNCIFSDGNYLFCYTDMKGYKTLHYLNRKPPYGMITLTDEDLQINLGHEKDPGQEGFIIATKPLTDESWQKFTPGELKVFKNGIQVFSSQGHSMSILHNCSDMEIEVLKFIRKSPHRVSLKTIYEKLNISKVAATAVVKNLVENGYLKQDSRDTVSINDDNATFYTVKAMRDEIDRIMG